jgi:large subunit ribosomal protein L6
MSRIGKKPVPIPSGVKVAVADRIVSVEGKGKLTLAIPQRLTVAVKEQEVIVERTDDTRESSALHGLIRSLINNMILGVTKGFRKDLLIIGVGYKAQLAGQKLTLSLGFSHPIEFKIPEGIKITVAEGTKIAIEGFDKQLVGEVAATIRRYKKPEPYKGKGIRYVDERITLKEGKSVG